MREDPPCAADQIHEAGGAQASVPDRAGGAQQCANPLQCQVCPRHPDEVGGRIEHRHGEADHADVPRAFIKVRFGDVERPGEPRAAVPFLPRVVVVVNHRGQGGPVLAVDRQAAASVLRVRMLVGDVHPVDLFRRCLAKQFPQVGDHARIGIAPERQLANRDVPRQHPQTVSPSTRAAASPTPNWRRRAMAQSQERSLWGSRNWRRFFQARRKVSWRSPRERRLPGRHPRGGRDLHDGSDHNAG